MAHDEAADDEEHVHTDMSTLDHMGREPRKRRDVGMGQGESGMEHHDIQRSETPQRLDAE